MPSTGANWKLKCDNNSKINSFQKHIEILAKLNKAIIKANCENWAENVPGIGFYYQKFKKPETFTQQINPKIQWMG